MGLFKEVKKPVIKAAAPTGAEISPLRPRYAAKTAPCIGTCPSGTDIREAGSRRSRRPKRTGGPKSRPTSWPGRRSPTGTRSRRSVAGCARTRAKTRATATRKRGLSPSTLSSDSSEISAFQPTSSWPDSTRPLSPRRLRSSAPDRRACRAPTSSPAGAIASPSSRHSAMRAACCGTASRTTACRGRFWTPRSGRSSILASS